MQNNTATDDLLVFFDTETSGLPAWKEPSDSENQPHIVQLAAVIVNRNTQLITKKLDYIVKPNGWEISEDTIEIHGITNEYAAEHGLPEDEVLNKFLEFYNGIKRVAYNTTFDNRIIRIAIKRFLGIEKADEWKANPYECAMIKARKFLGGKNPKLVDAYEKITGEEMQNAHNAMADVLATVDIYFRMEESDK